MRALGHPRIVRSRVLPPSSEDLKHRHVSDATRRTISTIGAVSALMGIEHGIGEILQGNVTPEGMTMLSWPESDAFRILAGEPAMTIVPNLLATGILAILASLLFLAWVTMFIDRKHGGQVLILLSIVMLLVGGGFGPPLVGLMLGVAATGINAPSTWWRTHRARSPLRLLATLWPLFLGVDLIAWLSLIPGLVLVGYFFGGDSIPEPLVYALIFSAFGFLLLTVVAGYAHDSQQQPVVRQATSMGG